MAAYNSTNVRKGLLPMLVLSMLKEKDMYGYEMIKTIEKKSESALKYNVGALYPVLYHLEEDGQITETRVPHKKRMTHVVYHLEPAGEVLLKELQDEYYNVFDAVNKILDK